MLTQAQIDQLVIKLVNYICSFEINRIKKREQQLVAENRKLSDNAYDAFYFNGRVFTDHTSVKLKKMGIVPSLVPAINQLNKETIINNNRQAQIRTGLKDILKECRTLQDIRDVLPNSLAEQIDQVKGMPRSRPDGFTVMHIPRRYARYQKMREEIEFLSAVRYIN